jgi:DNA-binding PadR family transcriptional regulator
MAEKEMLVLRMLMDNMRGLYGSEFVHLSDGKLGRGSIYSLLDRLVEKGFVKEIEEAPTTALQLKRTRHVITGAGQQACKRYADGLGMRIKEGVFSRGAA